MTASETVVLLGLKKSLDIGRDVEAKRAFFTQNFGFFVQNILNLMRRIIQVP